MPWKQTGPFEERRQFVIACEEADESFTVICERFGISRQKGYKWLARFEDGGLEGLLDRSRRPHSNSRSVPPRVMELIIELRKRRPRWGPRKLLAVLERDYPKIVQTGNMGDRFREAAKGVACLAGHVTDERARQIRRRHADVRVPDSEHRRCPVVRFVVGGMRPASELCGRRRS
jgi:transposase